MKQLRQLFGLAILLGACTLAVWLAITAANHDLGELHRDVARVKAELVALEARKRTLENTPTSEGLPSEALWPETDAPSAELALQNLLTSTATKHNLDIVAFGPGSIYRDTHKLNTSFEIEIEGPLPEVYRFIADLEVAPKWLGLGALSVRPSPYLEGAQTEVQVYAHLTAWILWDGERE